MGADYQKHTLLRTTSTWITIALLVMLAPFPSFAETAATSADSPYLRIEAGEHTAIINRISLSQDKKSLLTVSDDKTARLWNLPSGQLQGVMRVPIGERDVGALYAGALSPDGETAILAGFTTNSENNFYLYLYKTSNLQLNNRLQVRAEVLHLAYTSDGGRFAATFARALSKGGAGGVTVWESNTGKKITEDFQYGSSCNWVVFSQDGHMATSSDDGFTRIYDLSAKLLYKIKGSSGKEPYGLSFSDNGRLLAVGYKDKPSVDVIDVTSGKIVKSPTIEGLANGNLSSVAWSGEEVLAAGGASKGNRRMIRRWPQNGKPIDMPVADDTITSLEVLNGTYLYATAEPSWGIVDANGKSLVRHNRPIADFRNIFRYRFAISPNGLGVEWQLGPQKTVRFDLSQQVLTINPASDKAFTPPITEDALLPVDKWQGTTAPVFKKNNPITLGRNETSRSLAIAPDHSGFILGTEHYLRWFDAKGTELVSVSVPSPAYGVNLSRDGRYLVAALADGTIRWYRLQPAQAGLPANLEEYAAVFLSVDGKRWIAWTKEGFFAHSMDGGKNLAGYHLNRGDKKTPEWIDFGQLYQSFYSPSLIRKKMMGGSEAELQAEAAKAKEVVNGLFATPVPEVALVEYCVLEKAEAVTRAFRRVEAQKTPTATAQNGAGVGTCTPIGKSATRGFARVSTPTPTAPPTAEADTQSEEPVLQKDDLPAGKKLVRLRFKLKERNGGVGDIHLLRNGVVIENTNAKTRGFARVATAPTVANTPTPTTTPAKEGKEGEAREGDIILERDIELDQGSNFLQVRAYDTQRKAHGKSGRIELVVPAIVVASTEVAPPAKQKPRLHILSVGVNEYRDSSANLTYARKDAEEVANVLEKHFSKEDYADNPSVLRLYDQQATRPAIEAAFDKIAGDITSREDTVVVYLSGHGENTDNVYYFIPHESLTDDYTKTAISQALLGEKLAKLSDKTNRVVIFLDSCHSGAYNVNSGDLNRQSESISKAKDGFGELLMIAAAGADQTAADQYIDPNGKPTGHGPFSYAVIRGLEEEAAFSVKDRKQKVTASQISDYVYNKLEYIQQDARSDREREMYKQQPVSMSRSGDGSRRRFPLTEVAAAKN